jgi:hypothetical protein
MRNLARLGVCGMKKRYRIPKQTVMIPSTKNIHGHPE